MGLNERGLSELVTMTKRGDVSPFDIAKDVVGAVDARDKDIRAFLEFDAEMIIEHARAVTEAGDYKNRPLAGVPIAIKDNICIAGGTTTCASRILEKYKSPYDATVITKLREFGAVFGGKTNLDEFAMGSSTENSGFEPTRNPWGLKHTPGGSSGGSAAAVAADLTIAALGSDTGGSIRQPASFCGVVGLKPTYGRVSRYGLVAFASSLDQIGPITKNVEDCALLLGAICGHDPNDSTSLSDPVPDFLGGLDKGLEGLTVGVPSDFLEVGMDPGLANNFDRLRASLESEGIAVVDVSMPHAKHAVACYYIIANAEASSNLARYDGVKYGHRTREDTNIVDMYTRTREEGFGHEVKRRILLGTYVLSAGYYDAYYLKAQKVRSLIIRDFADAFERCDLILLPTAPSAAFKFGEKSDPLQMYLSDVFTIPVSLAGLPSASLPTGLSKERMPYGVQLVGKLLDEATVLRGASGIERLVGFKERPRG